MPADASVLTTLDGTSFVGGQGGLFAIDAKGRELWRVPLLIKSSLTLTDAGELCAIADAPLRLVCLRGRVLP